MINDFITGLFVFASLFGFGQQSFGVFSDPFLSVQLAASPTNGDCLTTDGTNNSWDTCGAGPGGGLTSYDAWTHPASGISATTSGMVFNSASSTFVGQLRAGHFFGNITGQSSTSLALAANGTNCSAGNFPLGVDAAGVAESCTDAWTEAENTSAAYAPQSRSLTVAGTAQQITSSAGAQTLAADRTWTLSLPSYVLFPGDIRATEATTTRFVTTHATATNATTTNLYVTNPPTFSTLTSALLLTGTGGLLAEYAGTTCTNQVATALSALGAATCTTITSSYVDSTILTTSSNSIDADAINGDTTDDDDLDVAAGGTGVSTITGLLQGNGTSDVTGISNSSTVGQILRVTGASTYAWGALDLDDADAFTGTLPIANTQLVAGRSVTLSTDTVDADSELYTFAIGANLFATSTSGIATTTEFDLPAIYVPFAATITAFNCYADTTGTSTIMATVATNPLSAGTNILYTSGVNCGAQVHTSTTTFSSTAISAGSWIRFYVSSAGGRPMIVFPFFTATKDD